MKELVHGFENKDIPLIGDIREFFEQLDINEDGKISIDEIINGINDNNDNVQKTNVQKQNETSEK